MKEISSKQEINEEYDNVQSKFATENGKIPEF